MMVETYKPTDKEGKTEKVNELQTINSMMPIWFFYIFFCMFVKLNLETNKFILLEMLNYYYITSSIMNMTF